MKAYMKDFIRFNRTNEVGMWLSLVAGVVDAFYLFLVVAVVTAGGAIAFGWWFTLPLVLTVLAVAHLVARPLVSRHYLTNA